MRYSRSLLAVGIAGIGFGLLQPTIAQQGGNVPPGTTRYVFTVPLGLPQPPLKQDNIPTNEGVALGKRLFNDKKLSINGTQSCASCHVATAAFTDTRRFSIGAEGTAGTRNAMPAMNLIYQPRFFWDARAATMRAQALGPIQNPVEMHETLANVVSKLQADATYVQQFAKAFGSARVTSDRLALAIEQYETTLLSGNSKFDRVTAGLEKFSPIEEQGRRVFFTPFNPPQGQFGGDCARCHGGPLFGNFSMINNGMPALQSDRGLGGVTGLATDNFRFKTPSLRNIAVTAPYMHDGSLRTLEQVVQHYSNGIIQSPNLDPAMVRQNGGVHLSASDQTALVAFMKTLTDRQFTSLGRLP